MMMMKLRKQVSKILVFILFGLLIASFAVWGIGDMFRGGGRVEVVAEVGDTTIDRRAYGRNLSREVTNLQRRFNNRLEGEQIRALGIPQQVLQQMITGALFDAQAARMGLAVSEQQIIREIVQQPVFQDAAGAFDRSRFVQALRSSDLSEQGYVEQLRRDLQRQQIALAASQSVTVSQTFLETLYTYREERRTAKTILVPAGDGSSLPEPDQSALIETHTAFAQRFEKPEYRSISLVQLRVGDLMDEIVIDEEQIRSEFEIRRDSLSKPERRSLEQLVLDDEALAKAFRAALGEGRTFAAAAASVVGQDPVVLEDVSRDSLALWLPELAEVIFGLEEGAIAGPSQSPFGWHVIRVTAIKPAYEPDLAEAREQLNAELIEREAVDSLVSIANQLDDELAGGASLEEAAARLGLEMQGLAAIDRTGRDASGTAVPVPDSDRFLPDVFSTPTGEESLLTETSKGDYFIFRVDGITPPALVPLDRVREEVVALWRTEEARKRAAARAETLAERVRLGESMADVAAAENLLFATTGPIGRFGAEPGAANRPELTARIFDLGTDGVATAGTRDGWLVAQLLEVRPGDPGADPAAMDTLREGLAQTVQNDLLTAFAAELNREFGVTINERSVEQVVGAF